jgi:hypothetical protein
VEDHAGPDEGGRGRTGVGRGLSLLSFNAKLDAAAFSADQGPDFERAQLLWQVPFLHICPGLKEAVPLGFLP